ncbi:hypothetical protein KY345_00975 [Candidatus Woesearchaeota archaeon]|nr:hypothetical protein [Candidatus Woesearchaeota archaeon]
MKLYEGIWYPEKKIEVKDKTVVDILTLPERSSVRRGYYDEWFNEQRIEPFAINYAWEIGDCSPVLRGFQSEGRLYEIDAEGRIILAQQERDSPFYDQDKIERNDFVFEGSLDEFIAEFVKAGYKVMDEERR